MQEMTLGMEYGIEPEWPPCPPPSVATSPFTAYAPQTADSHLAAKLARSLSLGLETIPRRLDLQEAGTGWCTWSYIGTACNVFTSFNSCHALWLTQKLHALSCSNNSMCKVAFMCAVLKQRM